MSGVSDKKKFAFSGRWIPEKGDAGQIFFSAKYWVTNDLGIGIDYRPRVDHISWTATYRALSEDVESWRPALILGTSVDDFTEGSTQVESRSYFATFSKSFNDHKLWGITAAPYVGAVYIDKLDKVRPLAGVNFRHKEASLMIQYSGTDTHLTLTRSLSDNLSVSAIYWGLKYPGLGMSLRF